MGEQSGCEHIRTLIPELALQVSAGDERAHALTHVSGCPDCRRELASSSDVVDDLLMLAPEREPPPGFESATLARLAPRRSRGTGLALACTAAVLVAAALASSIVWRITAGDRRVAADYRHTLDTAHGRGLSAAPLLSSDGCEDGMLFAYQGAPSWVYVSFRSLPDPGTYEVNLMAKNGRREQLRAFNSAPGYTSWGSTIEANVHDIASIQFIRSNAPVLTARFR